MQTILRPEPAFARPDTVAEALQLLSGGDWRILAGGTDCYPGAGATLRGPVLDLSRLDELRGIRWEGGLRIGAMTTWNEIAAAGLPEGLAALGAAALQVGGRQVQNAGTIGGNLCNASPAADGVPPLLVCGAEVELWSAAGLRRMALGEFLVGPRQTALRKDELLAAVVVPEARVSGQSVFLKLGARSHLVISIAMVAARVVVAGGQLQEVAVAVGSCAPVAKRLHAVEAALRGRAVAGAVEHVRAEDVEAALAPIDDVRATAGYRREAAVVLVRRAVAAALAGAKAGAAP